MPWPCVRGARSRSGGSRRLRVLSFPLWLLRSLTSLAVRVAGCPVRVSLPFTCWYAFPCALCVPRARSGCPLGPRRVSVGCGCPRAPAAYAPSPFRVGVARALRAVLVQGAGRAISGGSCPSAFPAPVLCSASFNRRGWPGPCAPLPGSGFSPHGQACASGAVWRLGCVCGGGAAVWLPPPWGRGWVRVGRGVLGGGERGVPLPRSPPRPP